jgi:hypothetical protein
MSHQYRRTRVMDQRLRSSGPYEAIIVNHLDRTYSGTLEVELVKYDSTGNLPKRSGQIIQARYLSPFYGVTPTEGLKQQDGYQYTQKSYGFWAVPPDPGTKVLVIFVEGNASNAYWIGCIQDRFMNFMLPDGRPCTENTTEDTPSEYRNFKLPVGEYNKNFEAGEAVNPAFFPRPYNRDFTAIMDVQGLLIDEARGTTTSSAVREIPSMVFGMSTPGPLDKRNLHPTTKYGEVQASIDVPFNRLGGSSFVMDDGDDKFVRATHASDGPPIYINREDEEEGGDETIPQNELIRFRTRTGHQIVMHNSEDFIYIANSRGTAWIELTSDGKIDIYAQDSISMFTDNDFNVHAVRDINMEAGRNINMRASAQWSDRQSSKDGKRSGQIHVESYFGTNIAAGEGGGSLALNASRDWELNVDGELKFTAAKSFSILSKGNIYITADESIHESANCNIFRKAGLDLVDQATDYYTQVGSNLNITVGQNSRESVGANKDLTVDGNNKIFVKGTMHTSVVDSIFVASKAEVHVSSDGNLHVESRAGTIDIKSSGDMRLETDSSGNFLASGGPLSLEASAQINILAGADIGIDGGPNVYINSGVAASAAAAFSSTLPAVAATSAVGVFGNTPIDAPETFRIGKLEPITLPYVMPGDNSFSPIPLETIVPRAPQHEPWPHHENLDPLAFKPNETDREQPGTLISGGVPTSDQSPATPSFPDITQTEADIQNRLADIERGIQRGF